MKKKIVSVLVLVAVGVMLFGALPASAYSGELYGDYLYYTISGDKTVWIIGCDTLGLATEIVIPAEIEGYPVTAIANYAFENCRNLKSIAIPKGVTRIGREAFSGCSSLTGITLSEGLTAIGNMAFFGCNSLTSITLPEGLTTIEGLAFCDCSSLTSITIPDTVTEIDMNAFEGTGFYNDVSNWENDVLYLNKYLLKAKSSLSGKYAIKDGTVCIAYGAFEGCSSLTSTTIPNGVKSIGGRAFYNCSSLTSITIPSGVKFIGLDVFLNTAFYNDVANWENDVLYLNEYLLKAKSSLSGKYIIKGGTLYIVGGAFWSCSGLTNITIPNGVESVGEGAFQNCDSLTSITIPNGVTGIGDYAFCNCVGLTNITIPEGITRIGVSAFYNCSSLKSVTIPNGVTEIGVMAFYNCSSLESITLPNSVTEIGEMAFSHCEKLYYNGTETDWQKIKGLGMDSLANTQIIYLGGTKTTVSANGKDFSVQLKYISAGSTVVLALYNGETLTEAQHKTYTGEDIPFNTKKEYTKAVVMVWESLENMKPICSIEPVVN